jgi:DNA-binding CsgD family transcriptional regulator
MSQLPGETTVGAMEPGLHRAERDPQPLGDLRPGQPGAGRAEESVAVVEAGLDHADRTGLAPTYGRALAGNGGEALVRLGRWDDAIAMAARPSTASGTGPGEAAMALTRAAVALGRGDWSAAETAVAFALDRTAATGDIMCRGQAVVAAAGLAVEQRRADDALRSACEASELAVGADSVRFGMPAFAIALCAAADRAELAAAAGPLAGDELAETRGLADQLLRQARALADKPVRMGGTLIPDGAAWLAVIEAEAARAQGHPDPELWATTAGHWAALGYPQLMAQARFREAEALLFLRGPRGRAARALAAAVEAADRLGAKPLAERVRTLARQARLTLATTTPGQGGQGDQTGRTGGDRENGDDREIAVLAGLGLTAREAEVLALVAEGYTNREVGERLFISHKTASVHVNNLLRKLDVPSRTAAAVLAHRLGASPRGDDGS